MTGTIQVLIDGGVVNMTVADARRRGVLGGDPWLENRIRREERRSHGRVAESMGLDGHRLHARMGHGAAIPSGGAGDETSFEELFEDQAYWG